MTFPSAWVASLPEPLVIIDPARKCCYAADAMMGSLKKAFTLSESFSIAAMRIVAA
jgi:hypothetical protein